MSYRVDRESKLSDDTENNTALASAGSKNATLRQLFFLISNALATFVQVIDTQCISVIQSTISQLVKTTKMLYSKCTIQRQTNKKSELMLMRRATSSV